MLLLHLSEHMLQATFRAFKGMHESKILVYKFLSNFSSSKKQTIADHSTLQKSFSKLENHLNNAKDIQSVSFQGSLIDKNAT